MAINFQDRHWCPAIETNETDINFVLKVKIFEIRALVKLEVQVEPTHLLITAFYSRHQKEVKEGEITSQPCFISCLKNNTKNHQVKAYEIRRKITKSGLLQHPVENETNYEQFESYFPLPAVI